MKNSKNNPAQDPNTEERALLKQWLASPAPGEDQIHRLSAPLPNQQTNTPQPPRKTRRANKSHRQLLRYAQNIAIALVLFSAGYFTGQSIPADKKDSQHNSPLLTHHAPTDPSTPDPNQTTPPPVTEPANDHPASPPDSIPASSRTIAKSTKNQTAPSPADNCKPPQLYRGRDGHFRVDTILCQSGSRATWVINPGLEIANAGNSQNEETHQ